LTYEIRLKRNKKKGIKMTKADESIEAALKIIMLMAIAIILFILIKAILS